MYVEKPSFLKNKSKDIISLIFIVNEISFIVFQSLPKFSREVPQRWWPTTRLLLMEKRQSKGFQ